MKHQVWTEVAVTCCVFGHVARLRSGYVSTFYKQKDDWQKKSKVLAETPSVTVLTKIAHEHTYEICKYSSLYCRPRLACSPLDPRFAGSIPTEGDGFLRVIKIRSTTTFGGEVKPSVPCRRFRTSNVRKQNSSGHFSPKSPDCQMLWQSHQD
jgi:hypothetical protein